ncbi:MAG: acyl-CoA dehydrogenase [Pseudomonadales bacterium]|nr:acyl-CoA dehydrogenase [Pseudomonadales bacterium]
MNLITQLLLILAVIWVLAYHRARMGTILLSILLSIAGLSWLGPIAWLPALLLLPVAYFYFAKASRIKLLTRPVFEFFRKVLPAMSSTEQEALDAGDVWWDGELFKGDPDWKQLLAMPPPTLSEEETAFLENQTARLCSMLNDWEIVHLHKDLPQEAWDYLKKEKFFGMIIPKEYGGLGFSALAHSTVVTRIATASSSAAVTAMVPNSLGPAELLMKYGTDAQRKHYLPRLASGEDIPCFALTGPEAGSDAGAMTDVGVVCRGTFEGKQITGLALTWNKRYITLAPAATVVGLAFRMLDPDHLLGEEEDRGITVALVPANHPGVEIGNRHIPMGMAFMNGPTRGDKVFIPMDWIIGGVEQAGHGWRMLVDCLSEGRAISLPALSTATAKLSYRMTGAYATIRQQFGMSIARFEGVEEAMARIAGYSYLLESARVMTAGALAQQVKPAVVSAIAKYHMTEISRRIIQDAMDVHAGRGLIMGPKNYLAHGYMAMPIGITVEGANILTRNLIIFGQGAIRCHPFIAREMEAARNPDAEKGLAEFDSLIFRHVGYGISNFVRTLSLSLTAAYICFRPVKGATGRYYQQLTRMSAALALVADISMLLLGGELKRKERLSARLGDVLSHLYLGTTVLKFYEDNGRQESDLPYVRWNIQMALFECQEAFDEFFANLPSKPVSWLLRLVVLPFGKRWKRPNDRLEHEIVQSMLSDNPLRDRITSHIYPGQSPSDAVFLVEDAFRKILASEPHFKKLREAVKAGKLEANADIEQLIQAAVKADVLTREEGDTLHKAETARWDAIQVDDHPPEFFKGG